MIALYLSGHGFGHMTRACEVLAAVHRLAPGVPLAVAGSVPEGLVRRGVAGPLLFRKVETDVGLAQLDALRIDEAETAARCRAFEAGWDRRVEAEAGFLRQEGVRLVVADVPAMPFDAAALAGVPSAGLGNFSWDWIYRHLSARQPSLAASADRAARAYASAETFLEMSFSGDLSAFRRREPVGLVARLPRVSRGETRRRLGLDDRVAVLLSFGGIGLPALEEGAARRWPFQVVRPVDVDHRLDALGLGYPDLVHAVDVVVTKPGYGIVSDAIAAGTRLVYTERGDFPEYPILVAGMVRHLACVHLGNEDLLAGRIEDAVERVLALPMPPRPDVGGADRAARRILELLASSPGVAEARPGR